MSVGLAVALRQTGWDALVPGPFMYMCQQLGRCSVPMALVLGGAIIYDYSSRFQIATAWKPLVFALLLRLVLLPLFLLALARWTTDTDELKQVLLLQASMPAGTFPIVMTRLYNQDVETAWIVVVGTSVVGLLSIPIWMAIAKQFLGFA
jgi:predicted permease